jgi:hypothetical protein
MAATEDNRVMAKKAYSSPTLQKRERLADVTTEGPSYPTGYVD